MHSVRADQRKFLFNLPAAATSCNSSSAANKSNNIASNGANAYRDTTFLSIDINTQSSGRNITNSQSLPVDRKYIFPGQFSHITHRFPLSISGSISTYNPNNRVATPRKKKHRQEIGLSATGLFPICTHSGLDGIIGPCTHT